MGDKAVTYVNGVMKKAGDTGTVDFDGSVNLGNADTDNIVFNGEIDSDIIPDDNNAFDLGSTSKQWAEVHAVDVNVSGQLLDKNGSEVVGGVFEIDQGVFQNPNSSYNPIFFPSDDSFTERVGVSSVNYFIAPFDGEVIQIQVRSLTDFTGKTLTASFHKNDDGDNAYSATASSSVAVSGLSANNTHTFDFTGETGTGLSAGEIFGFALELSGGYAGTETIHFTTVVKYNPYAV